VANIQGGASVVAKTQRIKGYVEPLLNEGNLFFSSGIACLEEVFHQFVKFDGVHRSGSTRKDDAPDCIAIALSVFYPRTQAAEVNSSRNTNACSVAQASFRSTSQVTWNLKPATHSTTR
jgi:hypothetical protein